MKNFLLFVMLFVSINGFAQQNWGPSGIPKDERNIYFEMMGGFNFPSMLYSGAPFNSYNQNYFLSHTEGISIRRQFRNIISLSGALSYKAQGVLMNEFDEYYMNANYLNLYVPIELSCNMAKNSRKACSHLFVFMGPYIAYNVGGEIGNSAEKVKLTTNEINPLDIGTEAGVGFRIPVFSMDGKSNLSLKLSYSRGFLNSFPTSISGYDSEQLKSLGLSADGERVNQSVKFTICYEMSLKKGRVTTFTAGGDGKRTYKKFVNIR